MSIEEYMKSTVPLGKRSVLKPYLEEIHKLSKSNYSYKQTQEYLKTTHNVSASISTIRLQLSKYKKEKDGEQINHEQSTAIQE